MWKHQQLYRVREPLNKEKNLGGFVIHYFSTEERARTYAKGRGVQGADAEVLKPAPFRVLDGFVVSGEIDK